LRALPHFQAAAAADPKNVSYLAALSYAECTSAGYDKAKTAADLAIDRERRDPLLYLLRGQAEAALAQMDPVTAGKSIGKAIAAFDRAAELDPQNSLPMLQSVSVALDVDRLDLALPRLQKALARPTCRLYQLPVPEDLRPAKSASLRMWEQLEMGFWNGLLSRCQNVSATLVRLGLQNERSGDLTAAYDQYRQALAVSRLTGRGEPRLFITVGTAMDMMDNAYAGLWRIAKAKQAQAEAPPSQAGNEEANRWKREVEKWEGETGILEIGRGELEGAVQLYFATLEQTPPANAADLLKLESDSVARVYRGIGLDEKVEGSPTVPPPAH
jgi:tetratricopeptide (TPR) repeat protein